MVVVVASTVLPSAEMTLITLILHHRGYFDQGPPTRYVGGIKDVYSRWDPDMLSYPIVKKLLNELVYSSFNKCVYLYPRMSMDDGLRRLQADHDFMDLPNIVQRHKEVHIYIDHGVDRPFIVETPPDEVEEHTRDVEFEGIDTSLGYTDNDEGEYSDSGDETDIDVDMPKEGTISLDNDIDAPQKRSFRDVSALIGENPFEGEDKYESEGQESIEETDEEVGLVPSLRELCPRAEHRFCMRHLWSNYSKDYKGKELKDAMWACARATTSQQFEKCMLDVKKLSEGAWRWLNRLDPKVWSHHAFRILPKNWSLTSNMCEQFNAKITKYRAKPVLTMAEEIRCKVMRKITKEKEKMMRYHGPIVPKVQNKLEKMKRESRFWTPVWAGDREGARYEVQCLPHKYDINLSTRSCSCNEWDLTGVPCVHVIAALGYNNLKPEDFVHPYYSKETFLRVYDSFIKPANGAAMWPQAEGDPVQPPPLKRPPGRPKKQRKREHNEAPKVEPCTSTQPEGDNSSVMDSQVPSVRDTNQEATRAHFTIGVGIHPMFSGQSSLSNETIQAASSLSKKRIADLVSGTQESVTAHSKD
ncbi:uncharacterized protein G2W53_034308 [Senna tora]|uniref:SWIM-type domain-containing protein n=1 Tax=Senna tora TaxID=362788 RepID=A0A834T3W0_9FABA|nr:uncharacterized protein G2W53_034308 [Senna tora]